MTIEPDRPAIQSM